MFDLLKLFGLFAAVKNLSGEDNLFVKLFKLFFAIDIAI